MNWGRGRGRKMGYGEGGRRRKAVDARITRGGVDFDLDSQAGTVTCCVCRAWGTSSGQEMAEFMRVHAEKHGGSSLPGAAASQPTDAAKVERSARLVRVTEYLQQLGDDELAVTEEVVLGLIAGRAVYGELKLDGDRRDFGRELAAEQRDALVYAAASAIQTRRAMRRARGGS